jgi:hypothetical protein
VRRFADGDFTRARKVAAIQPAHQADDMEEGVRFVPSRVEGLPGVSAIAIFPDRVELCSAGQWLSFPFAEMVQWPRPAWLWRLFACVGLRRRFLPVGERDWFHPPADRFIRFFSSPRFVVYLPDEPADTTYADTWFRRVQDVIARDGFSTWDLGEPGREENDMRRTRSPRSPGATA